MSEPVRPLLIVGIAQRSGTHLLQDLLCLHPGCVPAVSTRTPWGSGWEDHLVYFGDRLYEYRARLVANWEGQGVEAESLRTALDSSLAEWAAAFLERLPADGHGRRTVTKSTSAERLDVLAPWLLTDVDVVVLVRDPRAVLESARLTFGDSFERRLRAYVRSAQSILAYRRDAPGALIVRYEDLLTDRRGEVKRVLGSLGLDTETYDFEAAARLPIRGSPSAREHDGRWWELPWNSSFDGDRRADQLPARLRTRVEWVAGAEMSAFGYEVRPSFSRPDRVHLAGRDAAYRAARRASQLVTSLRAAGPRAGSQLH